MEDLVTNRQPRTLLASFWSMATSTEGAFLLDPRVSSGGWGGLDLLQCGIVYLCILWGAHLRGGIHHLGRVLWLKRVVLLPRLGILVFLGWNFQM